MGYVFGLLLRNPTAGKFIIFGFAGIFIYEPVKDAGLLAAGVFVVGIIIHHIGFDAIADVLRSFKIVEFFWGRSKSPMPRAPQDEFSPNRDSESEEETLRKYKEYIEGLRKKKSVPPKDKRQPEKRKTPEKPTRKPKIDSKVLQERQNAETAQRLRQRAKRLRRERIEEPPKSNSNEGKDNPNFKSFSNRRRYEYVLGLGQNYTLADLKAARKREAKRWNPSNVLNKPKAQVEKETEELKKINLAYKELLKRFEP